MTLQKKTPPTQQRETPKTIPKNTPSRQSIFEAIVNFFTEDNWHFAQIKDRSILYLTFQGKNAQYDCYAQAREEQEQFIFYSVCPIKVPKPKRRAVGEFISRANYGMIIGNFELDFNDGEIRYKTHIGVKHNSLISETIKELVYSNLTMMDRYLPGITSIISTKVSPEEAISLIEPMEILPQTFYSAGSNNLTDNQPPAITNETKKVKSKSSPPTKSQPQSPKNPTESDIFSQLTRSEISQFAEVLELQLNLRKNLAQTKLEQLKTGLKTRLGEVGEEIFEKTDKMFETHQFDAKQIRFIGRYAELYGLIEIQIERLATLSSQDESLGKTIRELEKSRDDFARRRHLVKQRLQQIAENPIYVEEEIDMLREIEEIREELAVVKHKFS